MRSIVRPTRGRSIKLAAAAGAAAALLGGGTASAATLAASGHPAHPVQHAAAAPRAAAPRAAAPRAAATPARSESRSSAKPASPAASAPAAAHKSWAEISASVARQTSPAEPKAADQLQPVPAAGQQESMPIASDQMANARTIVIQALAKRMGLRSAVIAVATSMQEAELRNIDYGTSDSLGLFQQQPDCGWGTAAQVMNPKYAADAFLTALQRYQGANPDWAQQPLWQAAQGVQHSAYPTAYAKWESQASSLVRHIVTQVR